MIPQPVRPGPGQESIWSFPEEPVVEAVPRRLQVELRNNLVADAPGGLRVLERGQAPAYYLPPQRVRTDLLRRTGETTECPYKGTADVYDLVVPQGFLARRAAWVYADPDPRYEDIRGCFSFYAQKVDACFVDGERVRAPPAGREGWITKRVVGPFLGSTAKVPP